MSGYIIVVTGYGATGKSTFATQLSHALSLPCFSKDTIKETLGDGFGPQGDMVYNLGSAVTFNLLLYIARRLMSFQQPLILESNFRLSEAKELQALTTTYGYPCLTFLFTGDLDLLYERYLKRDETRHWVHRRAGDDREQFKAYHLQNGHGEIALGQTIRIDTTSFSGLDTQELILKARSFIAQLRNGL